MKDPDGRIRILGKHKIAVYKAKEDLGVIVRDGRPVKKIGDRWIYEP